MVRRNQDGSWNHSPDHKGPWIVVPPKDVPERFKDAIAAGMEPRHNGNPEPRRGLAGYLSDVHEQALLPSGWEFPVKQEQADVDREVQMSMRVVSTELGVVARETFPSGEQADRRTRTAHGTIARITKGHGSLCRRRMFRSGSRAQSPKRARGQQPESLQELPEGFAVIEHEPGSGIWAVSTPDRDYLPPAFMSREEALAWTKTEAFEQAAAQHRKEEG